MTKEEIEQIKDLILWAKDQNLAVLTIKDTISVTFMPVAAVPFNLDDLKAQEKQKEEDLLFYSAR